MRVHRDLVSSTGTSDDLAWCTGTFVAIGIAIVADLLLLAAGSLWYLSQWSWPDDDQARGLSDLEQLGLVGLVLLGLTGWLAAGAVASERSGPAGCWFVLLGPALLVVIPLFLVFSRA